MGPHAEIMSAGFSGLEKMLKGKKFPQNLRPLRIIVEESLRMLHQRNKPSAHAKMVELLDAEALKSKTAMD